jgi:fermentation-respiration switch protein FrsA (DUF1100 family)
MAARGLLLVPAVSAGAAAAGLSAVWALQRRLIFFPGPAPPPVADCLRGVRGVVLRTSDGLDLDAWFLPARVGDRGLAVLLAPGNGGTRADRVGAAEALAGLGLSVLLLEYRGYGGNPGRPTEAGLARDVRAARAWLLRELGLTDRQVIYFGESLGTAVVTELAAEHPPGGLLLRSPFVDLAAVGRARFPLLPVGLLLRDRFPQAELLARVSVPTTVVYGTEDRLVPPAQSRAVAAAAGGPVEVVAVEGADHNDRALFDGPLLLRAVRDLADRSRAPGSGGRRDVRRRRGAARRSGGAPR